MLGGAGWGAASPGSALPACQRHFHLATLSPYFAQLSAVWRLHLSPIHPTVLSGLQLTSLSPVVYYMEGRDSMQLIYRWTKSLDPSLKKGFWAPDEDAVSWRGPGRTRPLGGLPAVLGDCEQQALGF